MIETFSPACPGGPKSPCSNHGRCDDDHLGNGTCTCDAGFRGVACELCMEGHFGPDCKGVFFLPFPITQHL